MRRMAGPKPAESLADDRPDAPIDGAVTTPTAPEVRPDSTVVKRFARIAPQSLRGSSVAGVRLRSAAQLLPIM